MWEYKEERRIIKKLILKENLKRLEDSHGGRMNLTPGGKNQRASIVKPPEVINQSL